MKTTLMTPEEKQIVSAWVKQVLTGMRPFSFAYDGDASGCFFDGWHFTSASTDPSDGSVMHRITYADPKTGLACMMEMTEYNDNPVVEWVVRLKNNGSGDTGIVKDWLAMDAPIVNTGKSKAAVTFSKGTHGGEESFALRTEAISSDHPVSLTGFGSFTYLPFFNVSNGDEGVISGIGWSGNWKADFTCDAAGTVTQRAGMPGTNFHLHPGEEVRSPRILLLFWRGDAVRAHNMLRRHIVAHHLPKPAGEEVEAPICVGVWGGMKAHNHLNLIKFIKDNGLQYDEYWIDAAWYGNDRETDEFQNFNNNDYLLDCGTWRANRTVYPDGMKPVTDAAHEAGMRVLLWFYSFGTTQGSKIYQEHPECVVKEPGLVVDGPEDHPWKACFHNILFRDPAVRIWMADEVIRVFEETGVDDLREDGGLGNFGEDGLDRKGIGEMKSIENLYAYWDDLLQRKPDMLIDNCGGGGGRIDLETVGRSLVLHRSDYFCYPQAKAVVGQTMTYGLAHWVPLVGGGTIASPGNTYNFRCGLSGGMSFPMFHPCGYGEAATAPAPDYPVDWHREMLSQFRHTRRFYKGDFYPLTESTLSEEVWLAYQLDRPDDGEGMVIAFRRSESPYPEAEFKLQGLDSSLRYEIENVDTEERVRFTGEQLLNGFKISIPNKAESRLIFYTVIREVDSMLLPA